MLFIYYMYFTQIIYLHFIMQILRHTYMRTHNKRVTFLLMHIESL